jgi:2-dehydro-3-deoxyphosphogluconate aldolase/(4S)-4-hydroxy-2-oxoglutarate aldolase
MNPSERLFDRLRQNPLIALVAPKSVDQCLRAYETLTPLGVTLEVAFRTPAAAESLRAIVRHDPGALVLAGTVMTESQTVQALAAGAAGVVSADYLPAVVELCVRKDVMCIPGGHGDVGKQLVQKAEAYGCSLEDLRHGKPYQWAHKLFPAATLDGMYTGLALAWKGPFPGLQVVYTGGLSLDNLAEVVWRDPEGIFCASALTQPIDDRGRMEAVAHQWIEVIAGARSR